MPESFHMQFQRVRRQIGQAFSVRRVDETSKVVALLVDAGRRLPRPFAMLNVRVDMLMQRTPRFDGESVCLFVDHAITAQCGIGDMLRQDSFCSRLVRRAGRPFPPASGVVVPCSDPRPAPFTLVDRTGST
ncbi:MAG: hypothetical protein AAF432_03330 [Planctomycetota bacterium]